MTGEERDGSGFRVGQGVDVHRFSPEADRALKLGGVEITGDGVRGLEGHSDADCATHAIADALLGAAGLGDLGRHFADTDARWAGADSLELLAIVMERVRSAGWQVMNADCTIVAEAPRLAPFVGEMGERLSAILRAPVNVKATRAEGMGALGRHEGIGATAVVLLTGSGTGGNT